MIDPLESEYGPPSELDDIWLTEQIASEAPYRPPHRPEPELPGQTTIEDFPADDRIVDLYG